ncbi:MAG TPA: hypothetical protein VFA80_14495 [Xanthobacteraceae bacterium]|nr:hypothetical protein [Xanthobacteraceae bacterium]
MTEKPEYVDLQIERRGANFALVREEGNQKTELLLGESDILALARIFPSYAHQLKSLRSRPESGIEAWTAIPLRECEFNSDLHRHLVLFRFRDVNDAEFEFSVEPSGARYLAERLGQWADRVENSPKPNTQ